MLHSLYIINKSGGLVYQQDLSSAAPHLSTNDHLRLGSTFHSMHAIAVLVREFSPCHILSSLLTP
jgi:trafficking protein particle complex subunit 4